MVFLVTVGLFVLGLTIKANRSIAYAAETASYEGVLVKHTNPKYTHKLEGTNVNLILNSSYNSLEGKLVRVDVIFNTDAPGFMVTSITVIGETSTQPPVGNTSPVTVFQGVLIKNPNPAYTHKLEGQGVNFILGSQYNVYEGKEVKVEVQFTSGNKFTVLSMTLV